MTSYPLAELNECVIPLYYAKKIKLSVYPTPNTDYQTLTRNYPYLIRISSVSHPYLIRVLSLYLKPNNAEI